MKKTLLIAAAALVAGIVSSEAQVYSANVVGYVNHIYTNNAKFELVATPLDASSSGGNVISNLLAGANGATIVQVWNGSGFDAYKILGGHWSNLANATNADNLTLAPGIGYFVTLGGSKPYTNTIVGNVVGTAGQSVTNTINTGLQLVGGLIPFADSITNTSTVNLIGNGGSIMQKWDVVAQGFVPYKLLGGVWQNLNTSLNQTPTLNVEEGFFFQAGGVNKSNVWVQTNP